MSLRHGERIGVIGQNGIGKSTLLSILAGARQPQAGRITRGERTVMATLDQWRTILPDDATVRSAVLPQGGDTVFFGGKPQHVASYLERFAFYTADHDRPAASLSGGEKNRLALARFLLQDANVLLLDEPTNDLDLDTLNLLEEALVELTGCALIVSHDRYFLDKVATSILAFEGDVMPPGTVTHVQGNYTTYLDLRGPELRAAAAAALAKAQAEKPDKTPRQKSEKPKKAGLSFKEKREHAELEARLGAEEARLRELEAALQDPSVWQRGPQVAQELEQARQSAQAAVDAMWARWAELAEKAEAG
jgi:ATP-binding cassette subfamily F protein uup